MLQRLVDGLFVAHPRNAGQGYLEHLWFAWRFGARMAGGAAAAFVHGVLPFVCQSTASNVVRRLHAGVNDRQDAAPTRIGQGG